MTRQPVLETIQALLEVGAEEVMRDIANRIAHDIDLNVDTAMHLTVATPGMWTDRLATEVDHRLLGRDPTQVLWWTGEHVDVESLSAEVAAQVVRLEAVTRRGPPCRLRDAVDQEGRALAMGGAAGGFDPTAAELLEAFGDESGLPTMVAYLYGDAAASVMGYTRLGLADGVGYRHAIAIATSGDD